MPTLYGYFRSSAAYRVRIALNLKKVESKHVGVHLVRDGGEQHQQSYRLMNPQGLVPTMLHQGQVFTQSLSIIEFLDETFPEPPLLPATAAERARVRSIAQMIACDIHPLNNLRVLQYLKGKIHLDEIDVNTWVNHWIGEGFKSLEMMLSQHPATAEFCHGHQPTLADICLIPQIYNAERYGHPMNQYPTLSRINQRCLSIPAFKKAAPELQPDAP